jgi:hypothetical protein
MDSGLSKEKRFMDRTDVVSRAMEVETGVHWSSLEIELVPSLSAGVQGRRTYVRMMNAVRGTGTRQNTRCSDRAIRFWSHHWSHIVHGSSPLFSYDSNKSNAPIMVVFSR